MPAPVEIRRLWHRARFDEGGVSIGHKPPIAWDRIGAIGADSRLVWAGLGVVPLVQYVTLPLSMIGLARRCLHLCVYGDRYPVPVPALLVPGNVMSAPRSAKDETFLRARLGAWLDRVPVVCPEGELGAYWNAKENRPSIPRHDPPTGPSLEERMERTRRELRDMEVELRKDELRRKHDL